MKSLALIAALAAGMSGCSSCSQQDTAKTPTPITCGAGTVAQGSRCVGEVVRPK